MGPKSYTSHCFGSQIRSNYAPNSLSRKGHQCGSGQALHSAIARLCRFLDAPTRLPLGVSGITLNGTQDNELVSLPSQGAKQALRPACLVVWGSKSSRVVHQGFWPDEANILALQTCKIPQVGIST